MKLLLVQGNELVMKNKYWLKLYKLTSVASYYLTFTSHVSQHLALPCHSCNCHFTCFGHSWWQFIAYGSYFKLPSRVGRCGQGSAKASNPAKCYDCQETAQEEKHRWSWFRWLRSVPISTDMLVFQTQSCLRLMPELFKLSVVKFMWFIIS